MEEEVETRLWSWDNGLTRTLERWQGNLPEEEAAAAEAELQAAREAAAANGEEFVEPARGFFGSLWDAFLWTFSNMLEAVHNVFYAIAHPHLWLDWSNNEAITRFMLYGGSREFFFVVFDIVLILIVIAIFRRGVGWGVVRGLEAFANTVGRVCAWAGLIMVLQQIVIVFMQRIFTASEISLGFGDAVTRDVSWWAEALKLDNAIIVALCLTYTFVQGGHVRVDLVYSAISFRAKRMIDMIGSVIFMLPFAVLIWFFGWFYLWRVLIVPNPNAFLTYEQAMTKARALRWNVETTGFSPNGFDAYFLFKILLVAMAGMIFLQGVAFFFRSWMEWREGPSSEDRYLDRDVMETGVNELAATEHNLEEAR